MLGWIKSVLGLVDPYGDNLLSEIKERDNEIRERSRAKYAWVLEAKESENLANEREKKC